MTILFADALGGFLKRARYTPGLLARLSGVPKATIVNWLEGRVQRPRHWQDVVRAADALRLSECDANALLASAGQPPLRELRRQVAEASDRALFQSWHLSAAHPALTDPAAVREALVLLRALPLQQLPQGGALPAGSVLPLARNRLFVGRALELRAIAARYAGADAAMAPTVAVTGLGGLGKTQLASEFAARYGPYFAGGVFWIRCEDPAAIPAQVAWCGGPGCLDLHPSFADLPLDRQVQLVRAAWQTAMPRLLVFDNCEEPEVLAQWRPPSGASRVLITSRRTRWPAAMGVETLALGVLSEAESVALLRQHCLSDVAEDVLAAIAAVLGHLPLALHLAGSYLARHRVSLDPAAYLQELRGAAAISHPSLSDSEISPTGHVQHVAHTFAMSVDRLRPSERIDRTALRALALAAALAPGVPIALDLLTALLQASDLSSDLADGGALAVEEATGRLLALGLVESGNGRDITIHRLVAGFARAHISSQGMEALLEQAIVTVAGELAQSGLIPPIRSLEPHLRHVTHTAVERQSPHRLALATLMAEHLWLSGSYAEAARFCELALQLHAQDNGRLADRAELLHLQALAEQLLCAFERARVLFEEAVELWTRAVGPEHADTSRGLNSLAYLLLLQGRYPEAEHVFQQALAIRRKLFGVYHADTARTIHNLGYLALLQGQHRRAWRYLDLALRIRRRVLPPGHNSLAMTLSVQGEVRYAMGDLDAARALHQQAWELRRAQFGDNHHGTAESVYNLGRVKHAAGDLSAARELLESAHDVCATTLGHVHRETLLKLQALGMLYDDAGRAEDAVRALEAAHAGWTQLVGPQHPYAAAAAQRLRLIGSRAELSAEAAL